MLYIEKNSNPKLPEELHEIHNVCVNLYYQIFEVLDSKELVETGFSYNPESHILVDELKSKEIHIIEWLKKNELNNEIYELVVKELSRAIAADFSKFIYHALNAAKKGHMSVAYGLLRKPLTDELLILEQLAHDPKDFVQRFFWIGDPKNYDPGGRELDKKFIINNAVESLNPNYLFDADFIFELRYDKTLSWGLNGNSNQALHIVTQDKSYKTLEQNLNFVFNTEKDTNIYWEHFYKTVPYLMIYAYSIIDLILFEFLKDKRNVYLKSMREFYRFNAFLEYTELFVKTEKQSVLDRIRLIDFKCPNCQSDIPYEKADINLFLESRLIICPQCLTEISTFNQTQKHIHEFIESFK